MRLLKEKEEDVHEKTMVFQFSALQYEIVSTVR